MNTNSSSLKKLIVAAVVAGISLGMLLWPQFVNLDNVSFAQGGKGEERPRKRPIRNPSTPTPAQPNGRGTLRTGRAKATPAPRQTRPRTYNIPKLEPSPTVSFGTRSSDTPKLEPSPTVSFGTSSTDIAKPPAYDDLLLPANYLELVKKWSDWESLHHPMCLVQKSARLDVPYPQPTPRGDTIFVMPTPDPWRQRPLATPPPSMRRSTGIPISKPTPLTLPRDQVPIYIPRATPTPIAEIYRDVYVPCPSPTQNPLLIGESASSSTLGTSPWFDSQKKSLAEKNPNRLPNSTGEFAEISGKRKVFVNATILAHLKIEARLSEYGRVEFAFTAGEADFAVNYFSWIDGSKGGTLIVTIRDPKEPLPRIVWREGDLKNSDAYDKLVKRFIKDLKKLRGEN